MTFHSHNRLWAAPVGLLVALLWNAQVPAGWAAPFSGGEHSLRGEIALTPIIESEWGGTWSAFKPDRKPDSWAVSAPAATSAARHLREGVFPGSPALAGSVHPVSLPGIRAPPHRVTSV